MTISSPVHGFAPFVLFAAVVSLDCSVHAAHPVATIVDDQIGAHLRELGMTPAPRATDVELFRRTTLDLVGRIPTEEETRRFLADERPDRVDRWIDEQLGSEEFRFHWARVIDVWLNGRPDETVGRNRFLEYIERCLEQNRSWDRVCRDMLVPKLDDEVEQGASYFLAHRMSKGDAGEKVDAATTGVASGFFGVQLQCAKCHDHPLVEQWKQAHYYGLGAFLARTEVSRYRNEPALGERADGEVTFVTTDQKERTAEVLFLDGRTFKDPPLPENEKERWLVPKGSKNGEPPVPVHSRRAVLAEYALNAENPYFARAVVNRLWRQLLGRGFVEPVDQMNESNPASHPELLALLAEDLEANGFDLRRTLVGVMHSEAYRRSSRWTSGEKRPTDETHAVAILRPLSPEQFATSLYVATRQHDVLRAKYEREKKKLGIDEVTLVVVRRRMESAREFREIAQQFTGAGEEYEANVSQALYLTYNSTIERLLRPDRDGLVHALTETEEVADIAERAWLAVLNRPAAAEDVELATAFLGETTAKERIGQLVSALFASPEFRFNH